MTSTSFEIRGVGKLQAKLQQNVQKSLVKEVVQKHTAQLQAGTQQKMTEMYTGHTEGNKFVKPTGATRRSTIAHPMGMKGMVTVGTAYFPYLEFGTRFMSAKPTLKPAFDVQVPLFISDLRDLVK